MRRIALFVEGETELAIPPFLHKWLDPQVSIRVGLATVRFQGSSNYLDDVAVKTEMYLDQRKANVVVGLLDLYGLPPSRIDLTKFGTITEKIRAARAYIRSLIPARLQPYFRQHFAVHETEAWLLAYPDEWPEHIRGAITKKPPEEINFNEPPATLLKRLLGEYKKTVRARDIFGRVDAQFAINACPFLRLFADDLLRLATALQ